MLKRYSQLFVTLVVVADTLVISAAWLASYGVRFNVFAAPLGTPPFEPYVRLLPLIVPIFLLSFRAQQLYHPQRIAKRGREVRGVLIGSSFAYAILIGLNFFLRERVFSYSRGVLVLFFVLQIVGIIGFRSIIRQVLRMLRRRGYNLRHVVVLGAGDLGSEVVKRILRHPEMGLNIRAVLSKDTTKVGTTVHGVPVTGVYEDVQAVLERGGVDQVILAMPIDAHERLQSVIDAIGGSMVDIRIVPDLYRFMSLRRGIEDFDGLPIINLLSTPLYGWNLALKRGFDLIVASLALLVLSPVMALVAVAVKASSPGPVFYRQERMGLDGHTFRMYKFRTMRDDAEAQTGPVWASEGDPRRTRLGSFLRRKNLDELPQLFNVLKGDMSLVGPRPERPVFIEQFQDRIPEYMLRHRMQAGVTGWAQVNGWRGNTSIERRIECDLYYIENWSLWFDLRILGLTLIRSFRDENAY